MPARTPRLPPEQRRRQLLDATLELLAEEGFEAITVEAVARRAGVTRPVVYDQFGDLDGLLVALVDREEQVALAPLLAIVGGPPGDVDPDGFLVEAVRSFLTAVRAAPTTWGVILMPPDGGSPLLRERVDRSRRLIVDRVAELLEWGLERRGGPRGLDTALLARLVVAAGEDAARLVIAHPRRYAPERLAEATAALVRLLPRDVEVAPPAPVPPPTPAADPSPRVAPAPATPGRRVPMAERREQLLDHALALLAEEGFDALSVEAIARRAQISRVVVYRAYPNLQLLLLALLRRESERIQAQLEAAIPAEPGDRTPQQLIADALAAFLATVTDHELTWRVALQRPESAPKTLQKMVARRRADLAERLRPLVAWGSEGLDAPLGEVDVDLLSRLLLTVGEELARIALTEPGFPIPRLVDGVTRFLALLPWRASPARPPAA